MSKEKMKNVKNAAILDQNNDIYDPDTQHNTGGSQVVIMQGGKPVVAGSKAAKEEKQKEKSSEEIIESTTRTTALPDMLGEESQEEVVVDHTKFLESGKKSTKTPKKINRIDTDVEAVPAPEKKKRGRPRKK